MSTHFDNTEIAFQNLTDSQLKRAYYLFKLMSYTTLVSIGNTLISFLLKINFPIQGIVKATIYRHFCGGETLEETIPLIKSLKDSGIEVLLNYSVEGLEDSASYRATYQKNLEMIRFSKIHTSVRAVCVKFTGYASIELWTKIQSKAELSEEEKQEYEQAKSYIDHLCLEAVEADVQLFVDAEESWFQDAIDELTDDMMEKYNKEEAYIFNTYQLYRNDKLDYLKRSCERAKARGYILGAKIVRGAYVEKENNYAKQHQISTPINDTKEMTDREFNLGLEYCLQNLEQISLCCASHNEESNQLLVNYMTKYGIALDHPRVNSSQLLGMSDNITYNLNQLGINTAKYMPFGPVNEVIPYLIRRAQENTSVEGQTSRELSLLEKEMLRRGI